MGGYLILTHTSYKILQIKASCGWPLCSIGINEEASYRKGSKAEFNIQTVLGRYGRSVGVSTLSDITEMKVSRTTVILIALLKCSSYNSLQKHYVLKSHSTNVKTFYVYDIDGKSMRMCSWFLIQLKNMQNSEKSVQKLKFLAFTLFWSRSHICTWLLEKSYLWHYRLL